MKDNANIYDVSEEILDECWSELTPGAQAFAERILEQINTKELPYVMSIEGKFGSGKTFFATRFCEYLKDKKITSIYVSAFEHDYRSDPLLCITQTIYKALNNKTDKVAQKLFRLIKSISLEMQFFGVHVQLKDLFTETDPVQEFKKYLSAQIQKEEGGRLVLIIDELDRCKPDFSIRLIEVLKHFFNIDGLFVILVFNNEFLFESLKSVYGATFGETNKGEHYITKFIDSREHIYIPTENEYENIVSGFIDDIPNELSTKLLSKNSYQYLPAIFFRYQLSLRQMRSACDTIVEYYKKHESLPEKTSLFIHLVCRKIKVYALDYIDRQSKREENNSWKERDSLFDYIAKQIEGGYIDPRNLYDKYGYYIENYQMFFDVAKSHSTFLFKDEGVAESFTESYLSELCEDMKKHSTIMQ